MEESSYVIKSICLLMLDSFWQGNSYYLFSLPAYLNLPLSLHPLSARMTNEPVMELIRGCNQILHTSTGSDCLGDPSPSDKVQSSYWRKFSQPIRLMTCMLTVKLFPSAFIFYFPSSNIFKYWKRRERKCKTRINTTVHLAGLEPCLRSLPTLLLTYSMV